MKTFTLFGRWLVILRLNPAPLPLCWLLLAMATGAVSAILFTS